MPRRYPPEIRRQVVALQLRRREPSYASYASAATASP